MRWFLALPVLLASIPANAEVYLLIKSTSGKYSNSGIALHSIPMKSMEQCEEAGALLASSKRFDVAKATPDGFECIEGDK